MTLTRLSWLLLITPLAFGCRKYAPQPLDMSAHRQSILDRDPSAAAVASYARQLTQSGLVKSTTYDPRDGLSLDEAEAVALFFNPHLRATRLKARVPRVGAAEAGRWEDPELRIDAERIIESVERPWVIGGLLNLTLPLSGRLKGERARAQAQADVEQLRVLLEELRLLAELRVLWLEWSANLEQAQLTRAFLRELDDVVQKAERLREAGELDPLDARLFRIERLTQAGRLHTLEAKLAGEEVELRSRLGLAPAAQIKLIPSLAVVQTARPTTQELTPLLEHHPRMQAVRADYEVSERALALEIGRQYPDLDIGGGFGTDEGSERVLGGIGLPLPLWNQNRRAIAEALAARDASRAAAEAEYEQLMADYARSNLELDAATARLRFVENELAPLVDEQLNTARQLDRLGNYNTLVLLEALKSAHDAKVELIQARLNLGRAIARIRALTEPAHDHREDDRKEQP